VWLKACRGPLITLMSVRSQARKLCSKFYAVPWCVPPWGWAEFACTAHCLLTHRIADGPHPIQLAEAVGRYLGMSYALPVNRGRTAIELSLRALQVENADIVLPSYLCHSVLDAVIRAGARPVFADMGSDLNVTAETVKAALTANTMCVIVAHLFGKAAPIEDIEAMLKGTGIALIDDAAQSFGARLSGRLVGTFGSCGIISCGPGKTLAGPAAGLLVTNHRELYERAASVSLGRESATTVGQRVLSFWMWRRLRRYTLRLLLLLEWIWGYKKDRPHTASTMSNLEAGIAIRQFHALHQNILSRHRNARILLKGLGTLASYSITDLSEAGTLLKLVLVLPPDGPSAGEVMNLLTLAGIECQRGYTPLHLKMSGTRIRLPVTEALWQRIVCIPVDSEIKNPERLRFESEKGRCLRQTYRESPTGLATCPPSSEEMNS